MQQAAKPAAKRFYWALAGGGVLLIIARHTNIVLYAGCIAGAHG